MEGSDRDSGLRLAELLAAFSLATLGITAKTAETHIERIYAKTGASTRATATLFAMRHGLMDSLTPADL